MGTGGTRRALCMTRGLVERLANRVGPQEVAQRSFLSRPPVAAPRIQEQARGLIAEVFSQLGRGPRWQAAPDGAKVERSAESVDVVIDFFTSKAAMCPEALLCAILGAMDGWGGAPAM